MSVQEVHFGNLHNIPEQLREIARMIEDGLLGEVTGGVLVINNEVTDVFGIGRSDAFESVYLMAAGQQKLLP